MSESWPIETEKFMAHVCELAGNEPICTVCDGVGCAACCAGVRPDIVDNIYERGVSDMRRAVLALLDAYDDALCARQHGVEAAGKCVDGLRELLGVGGFERRKKLT